MTTNRLAASNANQARVLAPQCLTKEQRERFWIDRGNRLLWGEEPDKDGSFLKPRLDLEWRCDPNGHYYVTSRA